MSDIFGGVEPPQWLQRMAQPADMSVAGRVVGELVGGLGLSAENALKEAKTKQAQGIDTNWIKELPGQIHQGLFEARMNMQNPMWKLGVQQAQLGMAKTQLDMQNTQSQIDVRKQHMTMLQTDQQNFSRWMQDHPTWQSRQNVAPPVFMTPEYQKGIHDIFMADSRSVQAKSAVESVKEFGKQKTELSGYDAILGGKYANYNDFNSMPKELQEQFPKDMAAARAKHQEDIQPRATVLKTPDGREIVGTMEQEPGGRWKFTEAKQQPGMKPGSKINLPPELEHRIKAAEGVAKFAHEQRIKEKDSDRFPALEKEEAEAEGRLQALYKQAQDYQNSLGGAKPAAAPPAAAPAKPTVPGLKSDPKNLFGGGTNAAPTNAVQTVGVATNTPAATTNAVVPAPVTTAPATNAPVVRNLTYRPGMSDMEMFEQMMNQPEFVTLMNQWLAKQGLSR